MRQLVIMGRKGSHQQQIIIANEKHLLDQQSKNLFPQCFRPSTKEVNQGLIAKCELKNSKSYQTKRFCPGCMRYQRGISAWKSAKARKLRRRSIERIDYDDNSSICTQEDKNNITNNVNNSIIIAKTVETIQEEKNVLLGENQELLQKIQYLESSLKELDDEVIPHTTEEILPHIGTQLKEKPNNQNSNGNRFREICMKLMKRNEEQKRDLAKSQAMVQHHTITISQLNSRVSFLQDQVSTLTFYYSQESHAHKITKAQCQSTSQYRQQQFQQQHLQQQQQQQSTQLQQEDPLRLP